MRILFLTIWPAFVAAIFVGCNSLNKSDDTDDSQTIQLIRNEPYADSEAGLASDGDESNSNVNRDASTIDPSELDETTIQQINELIETTSDPVLRELLQQNLAPRPRGVGARLSDQSLGRDTQNQQAGAQSQIPVEETMTQTPNPGAHPSPDANALGQQQPLQSQQSPNGQQPIPNPASNPSGYPTTQYPNSPDSQAGFVGHTQNPHGAAATQPQADRRQSPTTDQVPTTRLPNGNFVNQQRPSYDGIEQQRQLERQMGEMMVGQLNRSLHLPNMGFDGQQQGYPDIQPAQPSWMNQQIPNYDMSGTPLATQGRQLRYDETLDPRGREINPIAQANLLEPVEPGRWKENLRQTIESLEATRLLKTEQVGPSQVARNELTLRFLYLLFGDREKALEPVAEMGEAEQAYWEQQLFAMSELMSSTELDLNSPFFASNARLNAIAAQHQRKALGHLSDMAMLQIRNASFCRSINGFGSFEEFTSKTFQSGQEVLIYCELENLSALESAGANYQVFESELQASIEVFDNQRRVVKRLDFDIVRDIGRNRRLDFYVHFGWKIPTDLPPGDYYLRITVEDLVGDKATANSTPLEFHIPDKAN